jgi:hypothetical protein
LRGRRSGECDDVEKRALSGLCATGGTTCAVRDGEHDSVRLPDQDDAILAASSGRNDNVGDAQPAEL